MANGSGKSIKHGARTGRGMINCLPRQAKLDYGRGTPHNSKKKKQLK